MSGSLKQQARIQEAVEAELCPFTQALRDLEDWDRRCREAHAEHMAAIRDLRNSFDEVLK